MKTKIIFLPAVLCLIVSISGFSQKYKTPQDTVKLNKEWLETSNDIAEIQAKLTIAQNKLPGYTKEANDATNKAQTMANKSSEQASKATNGDVGDAKNAKKKAARAANDAEDAKDARDKVKDENEKIEKLTKELSKKQEKLQKLEEMRTAIRNMP